MGAGLLLSTPLTLLVVIARLGLEVEVIDDRTAGAIVLLAIGTSIILPWIFRALMKGRASPA
jgi:Kef-type K+ transport system membrane component KefB